MHKFLIKVHKKKMPHIQFAKHLEYICKSVRSNFLDENYH